jgi:predicted glycoside hydrolase/deacetylase ChbG (UPF0249 family)
VKGDVMKLIINGDDFGYTMSNTLGIIEAYQNGILRSTTALSNSKYLKEAVKLSRANPGLGVGVHLTLTLGKPLTENKTLHDENGNFYHGPKMIWTKNPDCDEIYAEWKAQIERFIQVFERMPTHLDSHHHVHDATPEALEAAQRLALEYHLPLRRYSDYTFVHDFYGDTANRETMLSILEKHKDENIEIMTHPGYCDLELYRASSYALGRVKELDVLCSDEVKEYVKENGVELVHY